VNQFSPRARLTVHADITSVRTVCRNTSNDETCREVIVRCLTTSVGTRTRHAICATNRCTDIVVLVPLYRRWTFGRRQTAYFSTPYLITTTPQPFYGAFSGTTRVSQCQKGNFWTLWWKRRLTEADTPTIRLGATPSRLTSARCPSPPSPHFLQARCPSNHVKTHRT